MNIKFIDLDDQIVGASLTATECCCSSEHGRRSRRGRGGQVPPEFGVGGTLVQIVPSDFCHIDTKRSVLWPSKYAKIRFRPGLCPRPRQGSSRRSRRPWRGDTSHHTPPHSASTHLRRSPCVPLRIPARCTPMAVSE